jgi:hypothetical protein
MNKTEEDEEFERIATAQRRQAFLNAYKPSGRDNDVRNSVIEEIAQELDKIKHDTGASYAAFIRSFKK